MTKASPKISIIIPVYNCAAFLNDCIRSVLVQSFQNFELILVNDGSTDASGEICDSFAASDTRVHVIHKKNGGVSAARNTGIDAASGEFLTFIDADDTVSPNYCMTLLDAALHNDASLSLCGYQFIEPKKSIAQTVCPDVSDIHSFQDFQHSYALLFHKRIYLSVWGKLFDTSLIKKNLLSFDESVSLGEDFLFLHAYFQIMPTPAIGVVNQALYQYIQHFAGSLSNHIAFSRISNAKQLYHKSVQLYKILGISGIALPCMALYYMRTLSIVFSSSDLKSADTKRTFLNTCRFAVTKEALTALPHSGEALLYRMCFETESILMLRFLLLIRKGFLSLRRLKAHFTKRLR